MKVTDLLDKHSIPYKMAGEHHHVTTRFVGVDCPFCSKNSGKFQMGIALEGQACTCWICGYHRLLDTLAELTGLPHWEFRGLLDSFSRTAPGQRRTPERRGTLRLPKCLGPLQKSHRSYLRDRGFDPNELERLWGIQGIGLSAKLAWRIWIPIYYQGEVVSWTTRAIGNQSLRYVNAKPGEEKRSIKSILYGSDYVRHSVVVVEGPTDVWRIGPGAVALVGLQHTADQVCQLARYPSRTICFDSELTAQRRANQLANELHVYPGQTQIVELESGKDAGTADEDEIKTIRQLLR